MSEHREIDVHFQGEAQAVCAHQIDGFVVDPGPESSVRTLLEALGDEQPRGVLLTHIHLDHAGAAGALVRRWPDLEVWVHQRGAQHVIDPSRLVASATRIYGDAMERLWGEIVPVPEANVRILDDAGTADGLRWPGRPATRATTSPTCTRPAASRSPATWPACGSAPGRSCRPRRRPTSTSGPGTARSICWSTGIQRPWRSPITARSPTSPSI
ncbi:MAG TPA: MBL fold metallo-hydrolase [Baekduia sp.]|uniref:MBL fold metallo-hydrolase n=1 Tax=Baekduia sp. TaxID=2600305 RepID=UPI002C8DC4A1|nr:MBL fold metallo-hydrolase [Baekduia sp.]HMJ36052.1 MBL fold metallo-hydrolase [Baekduia sp.]